MSKLRNLADELEEILYEYNVEVSVEDESIELYLGNPSSENYDDIIGEIEELCDDEGFTVDGDYEGQISVY